MIQYHPPKSQYVNNCRNCLHLWKPPVAIALPPSIAVGIQTGEIVGMNTRGDAVVMAASG